MFRNYLKQTIRGLKTNNLSQFRLISILFIVPFFYLFGGNGLAQNQPAIDSLKLLVIESKNDTSKINALYEIGGQYMYILPDTALSYYTKALEISNNTNSTKLKALCHRQIGIINESKGLYDKALEEYFKALNIYEEMEEKDGIGRCYNDIAIIHYMQESFEVCIEYLSKSYEIKKELDDIQGMANYYTNMASVKNAQGQHEDAIDFVLKSVDLYQELNDTLGIAVAYGNVGTVNFFLGNYEASLEYHLKSVGLHQEINNKDGLAHSYSNVSSLYALMADSTAKSKNQRSNYLNKAVFYGNKSFAIAEEIEAIYTENFIAGELLTVYKMLGDYRKALEFAEVFIITRDSMFNQERTSAIQEMETKYETDKKQQQIELQESQIIAKDAKIKQQKIYRNALAAGFGSVVLIVLVIVYAYIQKRKANKKIVEQNEQILEANEELKVLNEAINNQNHEIIDSINYAERIQSAMLPPETYITELLNENFILYKPRDIVSGDFYWIKQVNQYVVLVAADCTGHGVPGAFMSMLGISYLTEIVQRREITEANQVLNELRKQIKYSLRQHGERDESKDGIDLALCVLDLKNSMMQYSGANNPLYLIRDVDGKPELKEFKADRMPLGYYQGKDSAFTNHDIKLEQGDTFYLFSDGFIDQKGGKDNKRYMSKKFRSLLLEIQDQPMHDQKGILDKTLSAWMGNNSQMDDILVIGVRV
jgi:serine phosphatase RsbU (regulator of sigma subunit)/tetratricopeptide (TPR) repeat protein